MDGQTLSFGRESLMGEMILEVVASRDLDAGGQRTTIRPKLTSFHFLIWLALYSVFISKNYARLNFGSLSAQPAPTLLRMLTPKLTFPFKLR